MSKRATIKTVKEELQRKNMEARKFKTNSAEPKKSQLKKAEIPDPRFFNLKEYGENILVGGPCKIKPTFQPIQETPKQDGEIQRIMSELRSLIDSGLNV